jgi:two-component system sensor histidine kinase HydH
MRFDQEPAAEPILLVDDELSLCGMLEKVLVDEGYLPIVCNLPEDALIVSRQKSFRLAFVDIDLPGMNGLALAAKLKEEDSRREVVFITGSTVVDHAVQAIKLGAYDYLRKPFTLTEFRLCLRRFEERDLLRERIDRAERRYFQLVQHLPLLIYALRRDLQLEFINQACSSMLGYTPEEARETPRWFQDRLHPEDRLRVEKTIEAIFGGGDPPPTVECRLIHRKGYTLHGIAKFIPPLETSSEGPEGPLEGILLDISDHVFLEKVLVQREKLNTLGALSAEVAHEIRNPLVSIGGFARRLHAKYPDLTEAGIIMRECQRLETILDRIRTYLKPVEIRYEDCAVNDVINEGVSLLAPEVENRSVNCRLNLDAESPLARAARDVLGQVVINLIRNAVGATERGGVVTIMSRQDSRQVHVDFRNPAKVPRIADPEDLFLPFGDGGQSFGLPLCYRLVKGMGGLLSFMQEEDHVVFTVSLPRALPANGKKKAGKRRPKAPSSP